MKLYSYWRSSCSYRVRIALGLKGLAYETMPVDLLKSEQTTSEYTARNPSGLVPTLRLEDGTDLVQSIAILDWLEATYPEPRLLPTDPLARSKVLGATYVIAMDTQPLANSGAVAHLREFAGLDAKAGITWMNHFVAKGLGSFQDLADTTGQYAFGDTVTWADICLIPQLYNARRWGMDMTPFKRLTEIEENCLELDAFAAARPEAQPDAEL